MDKAQLFLDLTLDSSPCGPQGIVPRSPNYNGEEGIPSHSWLYRGASMVRFLARWWVRIWSNAASSRGVAT